MIVAVVVVVVVVVVAAVVVTVYLCSTLVMSNPSLGHSGMACVNERAHIQPVFRGHHLQVCLNVLTADLYSMLSRVM